MRHKLILSQMITYLVIKHSLYFYDLYIFFFISSVILLDAKRTVQKMVFYLRKFDDHREKCFFSLDEYIMTLRKINTFLNAVIFSLRTMMRICLRQEDRGMLISLYDELNKYQVRFKNIFHSPKDVFFFNQVYIFSIFINTFSFMYIVKINR